MQRINLHLQARWQELLGRFGLPMVQTSHGSGRSKGLGQQRRFSMEHRPGNPGMQMTYRYHHMLYKINLLIASCMVPGTLLQILPNSPLLKDIGLLLYFLGGIWYVIATTMFIVGDVWLRIQDRKLAGNEETQESGA
jgi:hypothetical protein